MFDRNHPDRGFTLTQITALVTLVVAGLLTAPARAQVSGDASGEASALNRRSRELYQEGRYAAAVTLLREAYRLKPEPVIQYNLALACEMMGDYACAVVAYESYLRHAHLDERASIQARLARNRARLAEKTAQAAPTSPPPAQDRPLYSILPPTVTMVGGVVGGVGLALAAAALSRNEDAMSDPSLTGGRQKRASAESLMRTANVTMIAGGTVAAAGIVWWIIHARAGRSGSSKPSATAAALHIDVGSVAISMAF